MCEPCHTKYIIALLIFTITTIISCIYEYYTPGPTPEVSVYLFFGGAILSTIVIACDVKENLPGIGTDPLLVSSHHSGPQYIYGPPILAAPHTKYSQVQKSSLATGGATSVQCGVVV